ncbi:hypothetical protein H0H92_015887 [Tricholoma furcatifolium]|nr:hypothetical protein H0H92_015887 [Tricholoma furcatifolium]
MTVNNPTITDQSLTLKNWLDAPDYKGDFLTAKAQKHEGTCEWMKGKQSYIAWTTSGSTPFLFIYGIPGAGKTVLTSWIINHVCSLQDTAHPLVLYHYFKGTDAKKRTSVSALRSLIDQLLTHFRHTNNRLLSRLESQLEGVRLDRSQYADYADLRDVFLSLASDFAQDESNPQIMTIILDAMDECQPEESVIDLVGDLLVLGRNLPGKTRVLVTGRKSALDYIQAESESFTFHEFEITKEDIHQDIQAYVQYTINKVRHFKKFKDLKDDICDTIGKADNHQGMFLWAYLMCQEVRRLGNVNDIQQLLRSLPKGPYEMYMHICQTIIGDTMYDNLGRQVLQWIVNSPRPLTLSELQEGIKLMTTANENHLKSLSKAWFDKYTVMWSAEDIIGACRNLEKDIQYKTSEVKSFVEAIQIIEPTLGAFCLRYMRWAE